MSFLSVDEDFSQNVYLNLCMPFFSPSLLVILHIQYQRDSGHSYPQYHFSITSTLYQGMITNIRLQTRTFKCHCQLCFYTCPSDSPGRSQYLKDIFNPCSLSCVRSFQLPEAQFFLKTLMLDVFFSSRKAYHICFKHHRDFLGR